MRTTAQHRHKATVNVKAIFDEAAADRTPVQTDTRRLCHRLHRERLNPPHLRANLEHVTARTLERLAAQEIRTTPSSVEICLLYIAQDGLQNSPTRKAIVELLEDR